MYRNDEIHYMIYSEGYEEKDAIRFVCDKYRTLRAETRYERKWPNHCRYCEGWGCHSFYQSHPYGSTTAREYMYEPCEWCVGKDQCPRCGSKLVELEEEDLCVCRECGFTVGLTEGKPNLDY